jgi:uncharacterized protein YegL
MSKLDELLEIANPQHPHCPTVLLLDTSDSMADHGKINELNNGLKFFKDDVSSDELARKRVDLAVVTFGVDVKVIHNFSSIDEFEPPTLQPGGFTPMGRAILKGIDLVEQRKAEYKDKGIDYYRPWIFMITDGVPSDMGPEGTEWVTLNRETDTEALDAPKRLDSNEVLWNEVIKKIQDGEANKKFMFFVVGVEPADMTFLKLIASSKREPVLMKQGRFKAMFEWLSKSQARVSASRVGEEIALEYPAGPKGWAEISST